MLKSCAVYYMAALKLYILHEYIHVPFPVIYFDISDVFDNFGVLFGILYEILWIRRLLIHTCFSLKPDSQTGTHRWTVKIIFTLEFPVRKTYKAFYNKKILVTNLHHILSTDSEDTSVFNSTSSADKSLFIQTVNTHTCLLLAYQPNCGAFWEAMRAWPNTFFWAKIRSSWVIQSTIQSAKWLWLLPVFSSPRQ